MHNFAGYCLPVLLMLAAFAIPNYGYDSLYTSQLAA